VQVRIAARGAPREAARRRERRFPGARAGRAGRAAHVGAAGGSPRGEQPRWGLAGERGAGRGRKGVTRMATKKMTSEELLDQFKDRTLLELSEFVKKFEDAFDVQAAVAAPVAVAPGAAGPGVAAEEAEEQTEFDLILAAAGDKKIQ